MDTGLNNLFMCQYQKNKHNISTSNSIQIRGVGTGPADPAAAGPKFALSIKIETYNSKFF